MERDTKTNITIPPAALERGTEVVRAWRRAGVKSENIARACFLAMIEAWPGMGRFEDETGWDVHIELPLLIPLPTEASDE